MIDLVCIRCGFPQAAHNLGRRCPTVSCLCTNGVERIESRDGHYAERECIACQSPGFMLMDSHALEDVPPARRALERARIAQMKHDRRVDVQLGLSSDGAF